MGLKNGRGGAREGRRVVTRARANRRGRARSLASRHGSSREVAASTTLRARGSVSARLVFFFAPRRGNTTAMMTSCEPRNGQIQFRDRKKFASGQTVSRSAREADPIEGDPRGNLGRGKCHAATWAPPFLATAAVTTSTRGLRCGDAVHASRRRHRRVASRAYHDHGRSRPRRSRGSTRRPRGEGLRRPGLRRLRRLRRDSPRQPGPRGGAARRARLAPPPPARRSRHRRRAQARFRWAVGHGADRGVPPGTRALGPSWALPGGADPTSVIFSRGFS